MKTIEKFAPRPNEENRIKFNFNIKNVKSEKPRSKTNN